MACNANLNGGPAVVLPPTELTDPVTTAPALVPVGADCVTLTFRLCPNPAQLAPNQVEIQVLWSAEVGAPPVTILTPETILQPTGTGCEYEACAMVILSPEATDPDCVLWDLSFSVPAGKSDIEVVATEVGDPANPGTLEVWVAFK